MKTVTETGQLFAEMATAYGYSDRIGIYAAASVLNSLAARGAECLKLEAQVRMPVESRNIPVQDGYLAQDRHLVRARHPVQARHLEQAGYPQRSSGGVRKFWNARTREMMKMVRKTCVQYGIEFTEGTTQECSWSPAGSVPSITVTGIARGPKEEPWYWDSGRAGQDIVMTGYAGMDGMLRIADEREEELQKRFAPVYMRQIFSNREKIFARKELDVAKAMSVSAVRQVTEGGVLAALWNLAKEAGRGLEADMKKLPMLQETIEVCEYYRLNPYQLTSVGSFLMVTDDGEALADALNREQVAASVIGHLTDSNDKILHNGEEVRYIDRPAPDEILEIF